MNCKYMYTVGWDGGSGEGRVGGEGGPTYYL